MQMYMMSGKVGREMKIQIQLTNKERKEIRCGSGYPTTRITALTGHPHSVHRIGPQLPQSTYEL